MRTCTSSSSIGIHILLLITVEFAMLQMVLSTGDLDRVARFVFVSPLHAQALKTSKACLGSLWPKNVSCYCLALEATEYVRAYVYMEKRSDV